MRTVAIRALAAPAIVLATGLVLAGCSGSGGGEGDFCAAYDAAGGSLATTGAFQVGMPPEETIDSLAPSIEVLETVSPPDDIAAEWQKVKDLYAEAVTIAEGTPDGTPVVDPRIFEILEELDAPSETIVDYLLANC